MKEVDSNFIFVDADAPQKSNIAKFERESRKISFHPEGVPQHSNFIFVDADAPQKSNIATFERESRKISFHPRGSPTTFVSIPTGTLSH